MEALAAVERKRAVVRQWLGAGSIDVFGIQFSGKDTQCRRLADWTDGVVLGGGDILRNRMDVSPRVRGIMDRGGYIPVDDFLELVTPFLARPQFAGKPLILSAVGRRAGEEQPTLEATEASGHPIRAAVVLEVSEIEVWRRWRLMHETQDREQRVDDSKDGLRGRLELFRATTLPVIRFYEGQGLAFAVDGSRTPDQVEAAILDGLYTRAKRDD